MRPLDSKQYDGVATLVLDLMPGHTTYVEPYFAEGEILFNKPIGQCEVINDPDDAIINFYMTVKTRWNELSFLMQSTLNSESLSVLADNIHSDEIKSNELYHAWACWFRYNRDRVYRDAWLRDTTSWLNGYQSINATGRALDIAVSKRLENVSILNRHATDVFFGYDSPDTLFYVHPTDYRQIAEIIPIFPMLKGYIIFYYPDKRVGERVCETCHLHKNTDKAGNTVYTNFQKQKTLFDL